TSGGTGAPPGFPEAAVAVAGKGEFVPLACASRSRRLSSRLAEACWIVESSTSGRTISSRPPKLNPHKTTAVLGSQIFKRSNPPAAAGSRTRSALSNSPTSSYRPQFFTPRLMASYRRTAGSVGYTLSSLGLATKTFLAAAICDGNGACFTSAEDDAWVSAGLPPGLPNARSTSLSTDATALEKFWRRLPGNIASGACRVVTSNVMFVFG